MDTPLWELIEKVANLETDFGRRRRVSRTAEAFFVQLAHLLDKRRRLKAQVDAYAQALGFAAPEATKRELAFIDAAAKATEATNKELAFIDAALHTIEKKAPWRILDRVFARSADAILAAAVREFAKSLKSAKHLFPTGEQFGAALAAQSSPLFTEMLYMKSAFPDLGSLTKTRQSLLSAKVLKILYGKIAGEEHGPVAAAEHVVAELAGLARSTVRAAREDLGTLKKQGHSRSKGSKG